jgi:hypothetical protein
MPDEPDVHRDPQRRGNDLGQDPMGAAGRGSRWQETEPGSHPVDVSVDRDSRPPQGEGQDAGRGLGTDSREREEIVDDLLIRGLLHPREVEPAFPASDLAQYGQDPRCLRIGQPSGAEGDHQVTRARGSQVAPLRVALPHRRVGSVAIQVVRVLGEDRDDQLLERVETPRRVERSVSAFQSAMDLADAGSLASRARAHCPLV